MVKTREVRGLSQRDLCRMSGLSQSFISGIETGRRNPSYQTVAHIARLLQVPMSELVDERVHPMPQVTPTKTPPETAP
ncbi:MAG: helix-turn-helix domain-containing protein [Pseudonocardiaceae bacterium]